MKIWPSIVIWFYVFFVGACLTMVWIAVKNPPIQIQKEKDWK